MNYTVYSVIKNVVETLVAVFVFTAHMPKRKYFRLKAPLGAAVLLLTYGIINYILGSLWYNSGGAELYGLFFWLFKWLISYLFTLLLVYICFDVSLLNAFYFSIAANIAQDIISKAYYVIDIKTYGVIPLAASIVIYIAIFAALLVPCYFIFARKFKGGGYDFISRREICTLAVGIIAGTVSGIWAEVFWSDNISYGAMIIIYLQTVMVDVFILSILFGLFRTNSEETERRTVESMLIQERRQYEFSKETIDLINVKCHDMKHMLGQFEDKIGRDELKELQSKITIYGNSVKTGNKTLDLVIAEKSLHCEKRGITFTGMAEGAALAFMKDGDIYSLFGNAFDNAIEACSKLENPADRFISYSVKKKGAMIFIRAENSFNGEIKMVNGQPVTGKADKNNHGLGLKSIAMVVKKYGGDYALDVQGNIFRITATITAPAE